MKAAVRYYSKTGNSKKLAEAIAAALGVTAETVDRPLEEDAEVLFLCNSVYWAGVDGRVKAFLKAPGARVGTLVNVSTAALIASTYPQMVSLAAEAGLTLSPREFHCRGSFKGLHRGCPTEEDLRRAAAFAESFLA